MEKQDLIDDWRENTYQKFSTLEIWKKDNQYRLVEVLSWDTVNITHQYAWDIRYVKKETVK